jgi:hypothetical protein
MKAMKQSGMQIALAFVFTMAVLVLGYVLLGLLPMILFALGFLGGFILWLLIPTNVSFASIKVAYFATLGLFILHKAEERYFDFFPALSRITGTPVPDPGSILAILLYAFAGAWLFIPWLVARQSQFGYYLAWTFFTSMGVIELAHFVFPIFTPEPYGYFPGMATVIPLAPVAWLGMWRLTRKTKQNAT